MRRSLAVRFWAKVLRSETCWTWQGAKSPQGYGFIGCEKRNHLAHRVSWELHFGAIPEGMQVCHRCDNPSCIRPDHLFLGTQADNMKDKVAKGRAARGATHGSRTKPESVLRGDRHGSSKLTEVQVVRIREEYAAGAGSQTALAAKYRVTQAHIQLIVTGKTWKHAGGPLKK